MSFLKRFLFFFLLCFNLSYGFCAEVEKNDFQSILEQADKLASMSQWNPAERLYTKVTKSPEVEERIQAYEGLTAIYKKLKFSKKRGKIEKLLEPEKNLNF